MKQVLNFTVNTATPQMVTARGVVDEVEMDVSVPALVVALESSDGTMHPNVIIRSGVDAAKAAFVAGAAVTMTLEVSK